MWTSRKTEDHRQQGRKTLYGSVIGELKKLKH